MITPMPQPCLRTGVYQKPRNIRYSYKIAGDGDQVDCYLPVGTITTMPQPCLGTGVYQKPRNIRYSYKIAGDDDQLDCVFARRHDNTYATALFRNRGLSKA